jgi:hypothetical protein
MKYKQHLAMKIAIFCDVTLVRTDISLEYIPSIIRVKRVSELGPTLAVTNVSS